ncbi:MAG TPA: hypothetical protein DIW47_15325 [Bacteroidetes bacterium]|nr:hypothetical protein [Bacteroidota bacterium]
MELVTTPQLTEAIAGLRINGLFHLNGFLVLIEKHAFDNTALSPKTVEVLIRVFEKEIDLLYDASQYCLADPNRQRINELQECAALLHIIIDYLKTPPTLYQESGSS